MSYQQVKDVAALLSCTVEYLLDKADLQKNEAVDKIMNFADDYVDIKNAVS